MTPADATPADERLVVELTVRDAAWGDAAALEDAGARALAEAARAVEVPMGAEVSVLMTGDEEIRGLNARFRGRDAATNVLSFPAAAVPGGPAFLGDIVLARETVAREAAERGLTIHQHVTHLLVHGFLHLLGFDHEEEADALRMERLETEILARLGIDDPYRSDGE